MRRLSRLDLLSCNIITTALILVNNAGNILFFKERIRRLIKYHWLLVCVFFEKLLQLDLFIELTDMRF